MVDLERELYSIVAERLIQQRPDVFITGEEVNKPPAFPAVELREIGNTGYEPTSDSSHVENHARLTLQINVYSAKAKGASQEAKDILGICDSVLSSLGFRRTMMSPTPNYNGAGVHRLTARYSAVASADGTIYYG